MKLSLLFLKGRGQGRMSESMSRPRTGIVLNLSLPASFASHPRSQMLLSPHSAQSHRAHVHDHSLADSKYRSWAQVNQDRLPPEATLREP